MADGVQDASWHAGQVIRRVLLRRNLAIDPETTQLVGSAIVLRLCRNQSRSARHRQTTAPGPSMRSCKLSRVYAG